MDLVQPNKASSLSIECLTSSKIPCDKLLSAWLFICKLMCIYLPTPLHPSCLHVTRPSLNPQSLWHTVPQEFWLHTSTRPAEEPLKLLLALSLTAPVSHSRKKRKTYAQYTFYNSKESCIVNLLTWIGNCSTPHTSIFTMVTVVVQGSWTTEEVGLFASAAQVIQHNRTRTLTISCLSKCNCSCVEKCQTTVQWL